MHVRVSINYISAERFLEQGKSAPDGLHIGTNVNIIGLEQKEDKLVVPFVVTMGYNPSIAQITLKGQAWMLGSQEEIKKIADDHKSHNAPPPLLLQAITSAAITEATVVSRSVNIPPPIPMPVLPVAPKPNKDRPSYVG